MSGFAGFFMFFLSFLPLWVSVLFLDFKSILEKNPYTYTEKGAVSKWLKQAMRGIAFFRNIFGQAKTECRKNGTQGIIFIRNSKWNEL